MIPDLVRDKNVLLAFGDPAGAKALLAYASLNRGLFRSVVAVSDKVHSFYSNFDIRVEGWLNKTPEEWLRVTQADALLTGTSIPCKCEVAAIAEASRRRVASFAFVDHWTNMARRFALADSLILPDWIGVIDDRARQIGIREGLPAERIVIADNPYHRWLAAWKPAVKRDEFLLSVGLPADAVYVLYAPEPFSSFGLREKYGFDEVDGIQLIFETLRATLSEKTFIVIKGHPNQEDAVFTEFIARQSDHRLLYVKNVDINLCSYYSECVLGFFSNSLVEARVLSRPVMRPLMLLRDDCADSLDPLDSLQAMEGPGFLTFRDRAAFAAAFRRIW